MRWREKDNLLVGALRRDTFEFPRGMRRMSPMRTREEKAFEEFRASPRTERPEGIFLKHLGTSHGPPGGCWN